jgi:hypothetical protein
MKIIAVFCVMVGMIAFWSFINHDSRDELKTARTEILLGNFGLYRTAVNEYVKKTHQTGVIPAAGLKIPTGWINLGGWTNLVQASGSDILCYVYGKATAVDRAALLRLYKYSATIGFNSGGKWMRNGAQMNLPAQIPDGALVSVIQVEK